MNATLHKSRVRWEWLLLLVGLAGILGNLLHIPILTTFVPGVTEAVETSTSILFLLLGATFYFLLHRSARFERDRRMRALAGLALLYMMSFGVYIFALYMVASHFHPLSAIVYRYEVPYPFVGSLVLIFWALALGIFIFVSRSLPVVIVLGMFSFLSLGVDIFSVVGHWLNVPILFNYGWSYPGIIGSMLVSFLVLQATTPYEGLLSPLAFPSRRVRGLALTALLMAVGILAIGLAVINQLESYLKPELLEDLYRPLHIYLLLEYGPIIIAVIGLTLVSRALYYYCKAQQAGFELRELNRELEQRVAQRTAELETAVNKLEQLNEARRAFAYLVSYDLQAPLRIISSFIKTLQKQATSKLDEEERDLLRRVNDRCMQMSRLVEDLLQLSAVEYYRLQTQTANVSQLAWSIIEELREQEPDRQVDVRIEPDLYIRGDQRLLSVILFNLLQNAWKYTGKRPDGKIEFGRTMVQDKMTYFVRDNGVGFSMLSAADRLFKPFQRLHPKTAFNGSGIGLAAVAKAIERFHGTIWAASSPGEGATFYFRLPEEMSISAPPRHNTSAKRASG